MSVLDDLTQNKEVSSTTLPSWYQSAQQNAVSSAANVQAPGIQDTAAQSAINAFGANNPFAAGQSTLQAIGTGAANPWLVSDTGQVSPDVSTPMGGLFQAQRDYFNQIMPDIAAQEDAGAIAGGGFGSKMNLAGVAREYGKAYSDLAQKQMQSALQNQQTGVAAGTGLGNVGNQMIQSALNTGTYQQNAPYASATNLANVLKSVTPDKTSTKELQLGGLNQIMGLLAATQGSWDMLGGGYLRDSKGNVVKGADGKPVMSGGLIDRAVNAIGNLVGSSGGLPTTDGAYGSGQYYDNVYISPSGEYVDTNTGEVIWTPPPSNEYDNIIRDDYEYDPGQDTFQYPNFEE